MRFAVASLHRIIGKDMPFLPLSLSSLQEPFIVRQKQIKIKSTQQQIQKSYYGRKLEWLFATTLKALNITRRFLVLTIQTASAMYPRKGVGLSSVFSVLKAQGDFEWMAQGLIMFY